MTKQIIYCGWDTPPVASLPGVPSYSQQQPSCRGVDSFVAQAVRGPNHKQLLNLASPEPWIKEDFKDYPPGTGLLWARLLGGNKSIPPWYRVCEHARLLSDVAEDHWYDGILLDIESYKNTVPIFQCPPDVEFNLAATLVFNRGRQFAVEVEGTLAFHRLLSHLIDLVPPVGSGDRQIPLKSHLYGLLPSFIAGLLSAGATLIDFCGTNLPREPDEVYEQFASVRSILPNICNIANYSGILLGQSLYLDQFVKGSNRDFYGMLQAHHRCSEAGVLLYGEAGRLCEPNPSIHAPPTPYPLWTDAIPNFSDSLCRVANPVSFARDFTESHQSILGDWRFGKRPGSAIAQLTTDRNTLVGSGGGWLFQQIAVKPGQSFAFSCQTTRQDNVWMGGRWPYSSGWIEDRRSSRKFYSDEQGRCSGTIVAPPLAETLLVTMAVEHRLTSDKTTFTDAKVCRI